MYEPERPIEPPEPEIVTCCCVCDEIICEGDGYYRIDDKDFCEFCGPDYFDRTCHTIAHAEED